MPNLLTTGFLLTCAGFISFVPVFSFLYILNGEKAADAFYHTPSFRMSFNRSLASLHTAQQAAMVTGLRAAWLPLVSVAVLLVGISLMLASAGYHPVTGLVLAVGFLGALMIFLGYATYYRAHAPEIEQALDRFYVAETTHGMQSDKLEHGPFRDPKSRVRCLSGAALLAATVLILMML